MDAHVIEGSVNKNRARFKPRNGTGNFCLGVVEFMFYSHIKRSPSVRQNFSMGFPGVARGP